VHGYLIDLWIEDLFSNYIMYFNLFIHKKYIFKFIWESNFIQCLICVGLTCMGTNAYRFINNHVMCCNSF
jgi:hypothetical protein